MSKFLLLPLLMLSSVVPLAAQTSTHTGVAPSQMVEVQFRSDPAYPNYFKISGITRVTDNAYLGTVPPQGKLLVIREAQIPLNVGPSSYKSTFYIKMVRGDSGNWYQYFGVGKNITWTVNPSSESQAINVTFDFPLGIVGVTPYLPAIGIWGSTGQISLPHTWPVAWGYLVDAPTSATTVFKGIPSIPEDPSSR